MRKPYWRRGEYRTIDNTLLLPQFLYHIFIIFRLRNLSKLMCWSLYLIGWFTLDRKWRHLVNTNLKYMKPLQFSSKSNSFTMHPITRLKNTLLMPILDSLCQIDYILVYINSLKKLNLPKTYSKPWNPWNWPIYHAWGVYLCCQSIWFWKCHCLE